MDEVDSAEHVKQQNNQDELPSESIAKTAHQRCKSELHEIFYQNFLPSEELGVKNASSKGTDSSNGDDFDQ